MYLDALVKVPEAKGKITYRTKGGTTYVEYESGRIYVPEKKYTTVSRKTIGKLTDADEGIMLPNENFLKFFPETRLPEEKDLQVFSVVMKARPLCDPDVSEEEQVIRDLRRRDHFLERVVSVAAFLAGIGKPAQFLYFNAGVSRLLVENYDGLQELCSALSGDLVLRGDMERADLELMLEAERWQFPVLTLTESEDYDGMDGTDTTDREEVGSLQGKASESEGIDGSPARGQTAGA